MAGGLQYRVSEGRRACDYYKVLWPEEEEEVRHHARFPVYQKLYWDNGKEHGNYHDGFYGDSRVDQKSQRFKGQWWCKIGLRKL